MGDSLIIMIILKHPYDDSLCCPVPAVCTAVYKR